MTTLFVGLSTLDIHYFADEFPTANVKVKTDEPNLLIGGPATNAAVAYSFLGGNPVLMSGVGNSHFRHLFYEDFDRCNITHFDLYPDMDRLPVIASVITSKNNGDRNIFTHNPSFEDIRINAPSILDNYKPNLLMIDGFYPQVSIPLAKEAKKRNIPVVFDGGSWKPYLDDLLEFVDFAICSANFIPPGCANFQQVFHYLKAKNITNSAITRGYESILFCDTIETGEIPVKPINAVDTLGAGDFFHGAFCYYLLNEKSFKKALGLASVIASKTCEFSGTREWRNKLNKNTFL